MSTPSKIGVVLMTYGSATTAEGVRDYFQHIYPGKVSAATIAEFERRYALVGHSPLVEITKKQARLLQESLGKDFVIRAGMRHSEPFIEKAVNECVQAGAKSLIGIILSPQFSSFIMEGYKKDFLDATQKYGCEARVVDPWPTEPHFIELLAQKILQEPRMPVIFTTHSLPKRVVDRDPSYVAQLKATIDAVRAQLPADLQWYAAYQSAGHTPEEWLKPDLIDVLKELSYKKARAVLIGPIQFLSDHLEVLYDLDIAAREQCEQLGIAYNRIALPNTDPLFIEALKAVVEGAQ